MAKKTLHERAIKNLTDLRGKLSAARKKPVTLEKKIQLQRAEKKIQEAITIVQLQVFECEDAEIMK